MIAAQAHAPPAIKGLIPAAAPRSCSEGLGRVDVLRHDLAAVADHHRGTDNVGILLGIIVFD